MVRGPSPTSTASSSLARLRWSMISSLYGSSFSSARPRRRDDPPGEALPLLDDLAHALLDPVQVLGPERLATSKS
jgi:hypothetical protein